MFIDRIVKPPYQYCESVFSDLKSSPYPTVVWGAGQFARNLIPILLSNNVQISNVVVSDEFYMPNQEISGYTIQPFSKLNTELKTNIVVAFCPPESPHSEFMNKIKQYPNYSFKLIDCGLGAFNGNRIFTYKYILDHLQEFEQLYSMCADELSQDVIINFINAALTADISYLSSVCEGLDFLKTIVNDSGLETFVDCGAYDGDTIDRFISAVNGKYSHIYAFEPDPKNYEKLKEHISNEGIANITYYNYAVWNKTETLSFVSQGDTASNVCGNNYSNNEENIIKLSAVSIDEIVDNKNKITLIKMDIEGAELNALEGAKKTIIKDKPKCAICVYHKLEDLITIPAYLKKLNPCYKIYFRQHAYGTMELLCYAL